MEKDDRWRLAWDCPHPHRGYEGRVNMGKPNGLTADLRVVTPASWEDAVWDAVERCIAAGVSPETFRRAAACAWAEELAREAKHAAKVLSP